MSELLHQFIANQARTRTEQIALQHKDTELSYGELWQRVSHMAQRLVAAGLKPGDRVAVYLPKQIETVVGLFAAAAAGGVMVPVNPLLKPHQVAYILKDCNVRVLLTSEQRGMQLNEVLPDCADLNRVLLTDVRKNETVVKGEPLESFLAKPSLSPPHRRIDDDMVAIMYTSGSTGNPKGVVLSHRNMVTGAKSVAEYVENTPEDRLLAVLPLSFDYGLSQLTTAFFIGARAVLMEYLLPRDVIKAVARYHITGLAAVPPLWVQLSQLEWPEKARQSLRYFTNSGGAMPQATLRLLREQLPNTTPYLMYGLTEAFRSTYLPPEEVNRRPTSMGKAIPNAEVLVIKEDGTLAGPGEPGELVHRGALVSQGYWNAPEKTAVRFKPLPFGNVPGLRTELAVWSGDTVKMDEEGFLYFIGRKDDMIKCSGNRISPSELEDLLYQQEQVAEVAALGIPHFQLGQAVVLVVKPSAGELDKAALMAFCKQQLPNFMHPKEIIVREQLPRNPNGKIDRKTLSQEYQDLFAAEEPTS